MTKHRELEVYLRDGFVDRYTGHKLVYPGVLKLLTENMPDEFPYTSTAKQESTHIAYYDLRASIDHVDPKSRGGDNKPYNLITTSWRNNRIKSNYTLDEIGEQLLPPGDLKEWDGLFSWYGEYLNRAARNR